MVKVVPLMLDSYMAVVQNSIGTKAFQDFYALVDGKKKNITDSGDLSCAAFVSATLLIFKLIREFHVGVDGLLKDLDASGWKVIRRPKTGCLVVWGLGKDGHKHVGVYIGHGLAVSNMDSLKSPAKHKLDYWKNRPILAYYWNKKLEQN